MGKKFNGSSEAKLGYDMFYAGKPKPDKSPQREAA